LNKKLNILFLSSWYPSRVLPYNGDFIQRHAEAISLKNNVTVFHVISDSQCKSNLEIDESFINNVITKIIYIKATTNIVLKFFRFFKAYQIIIKSSDKFDIVHVNKLYPIGIVALYLKWFRKKNFVISEHWTGYQINSKFNITNFEIFISKIITKNASHICTVSKNLCKSMLATGLLGNYTVVPNVVDTEQFCPVSKINNSLILLHISSMADDHKNISGILETLAELKKEIKNFKFYLIGNGSIKYSDKIQKLHLMDQIVLIDQIRYRDIPNYMQQSDLFILFSNYENLPCVILEAFACGLPVISTDVGGISEYFPENFGCIIKRNDKSALLKNIIKMYKAKRKPSPTAMHTYAKQNFSPSVICDSFNDVYYKALSIKT
jgi:glycosyltransferase involved in cell wall biosynthesis